MKVLFYDLETSPNLGYTWGRYEQNVISFKKEWQILSFAYKFHGEKEIHCVTSKGQKDDKKLCKALHKVLRSADIIVAHNGDAFDLKKARARFLAHGLPPLKPVATVDTLKVARNLFALTSNKLDDLGNYLKVGRKLKTTGFDLWLGCMAGNPKSWKTMAEYNKQDVLLLERVYDSLLPWMTRHPSLSLLRGSKEGCPKCGSANVVKQGLRANSASLQQQMQCKECQGWYLTRFKKEPK